MKQFVAFRLFKELYGVPIMQVQEIIQKPLMTRMPQMPDFVEGVINLRGRIVPVVDLRKRFGMEAGADESQSRIIVTQTGVQAIGVVVDFVLGVINLDESTIEPVPESLQTIDKAYIDGIGKRQDEIIVLLSLEKLLNETEKTSLTA